MKPLPNWAFLLPLITSSAPGGCGTTGHPTLRGPYVDFYVILFIPIAVFGGEYKFSGSVKMLLAGTLSAFLGLNALQCFQYATGIIHETDMNKKRYKAIFLKTHPSYRYQFGGSLDIEPFHREKFLLFEAFDNFNGNDSPFHTDILAIDPKSEGNTVSDYRGREFNTVLRTVLDSITDMRRMVFLEIDFELLQCDSASAEKDALMVLEIRDANGNLNWYGAKKLSPEPFKSPDLWHSVQYGISFNCFEKGDALSFYVWNKFGRCILIDDIALRLYA